VDAQLTFKKYLDFSQFPRDWRVCRAAVDWQGSPLLLVDEGKPPYPSGDASTEARIRWFNTLPRARHLVYWDGTSQTTLTLDKSAGIGSFQVQRFGEGWLLGGGRGGRTDVCDNKGRLQRTLDLGDSGNDVQTTSDGHIWVSYSDEEVFGGGVGQHGVVCFDSAGRAIFKYSEFADQNQLPRIVDCYAMNVVNAEEVWLSYYSDFPLVSIKNFQLNRAWKNFGCMNPAFAILGETVISQKCYTRMAGKSQLLRRSISGSAQTEPAHAIDEKGVVIDGLFTAIAKGPNFYVLTDTALYELQSNR